MSAKVKQIYASQALATGAGTDIHPVEVDFQNIGQTAEFLLSAKIVGNATAPGGSRTVTPNLYWSDEKLALPSDAPTVLAARKQALSALAIANSVSATRQYQCVASTGLGGTNSAGVICPFRPLARYLYVTVDKTTEDANAVSTLTLNVVKLRTPKAL